jgi:hypothetical protein
VRRAGEAWGGVDWVDLVALELACPMLYRPVVVSYTTTVDNLQSRTDYEVHILGGNKDPKDPVFVTKVTTK